MKVNIQLILCSLSVLLCASTGYGNIVIYSEDFSSAPTLNETVNNGNSNYAGTGTLGPNGANDLNQNEWYRRNHSSGGDLTYDAVDENLDISFNSANVLTLIDLTTLENDPGDFDNFTISFDVIAISGTVNLWAYAGGGLDYNGTTTGNGYIFFRVYNDTANNDYPDLIQFKNGATGANKIDGANPPAISSTGTFKSDVFTLANLGSAGDYILLSFFGSGNPTLTIDNLRVNAVPHPGSVFRFR